MKITRQELRQRLYKRRYLVPNAVTLGNMFCGFLTIIYATSERYEKAVLAIGIAILLDGLDGRVARRLNATSKFGVEFDSFSDLVSFGIGPAILMYCWCFRVLADEVGVFFSFVYALCAASRLARFNITEPSSKGFVGLPTPGAAGLVAAIVNFAPRMQPTVLTVIFGSFALASLAYLMVSKVSFLKVQLHRGIGLNLWGTLALGTVIALIWKFTEIGFLVLAGGYVLSGPLGVFKSLMKRPVNKGVLVNQVKDESI
jgi:CDP-diacylglycerol---serine O-phosphatidyltransferase